MLDSIYHYDINITLKVRKRAKIRIRNLINNVIIFPLCSNVVMDIM